MELGNILEGKPVVAHQAELFRKKIAEWESVDASPQLTLATVQFGESDDITLYSQALSRTLGRFGVRHIEKRYPGQTRRDTSIADLLALYDDPYITGVLIYSPIPASVDADKIFMRLPMDKDVEGRTFMKRHPFGVFSPTAKAVMALLSHLQRIEPGFTLKHKNAVIVGHSDLVGKPMAVLLSDAGATVTICHQHTHNLPAYIARADILVVAIGKPRFIQGSWIKKGAVVVDVGENMVDNKVVGDVDFESARERASYISPVPGGVGPLTNLMIIENLMTLQGYRAVYENR